MVDNAGQARLRYIAETGHGLASTPAYVRQIANMVGCTEQSVRNWIAGKTPSMRWKLRLLELFGIPIDAWYRAARKAAA